MSEPIKVRSARCNRLRSSVALAILLGPALAGCATSIVQGGRVNQRRVASVEDGLQRIRGLDFTAPVPLVVRSPDQAEEILSSDLVREQSEEELEVAGRVGAMLGLYPSGIDLKGATVELLKSEVAAFYDPDHKQMVLVEGAGEKVALGFLNRAAELIMGRDFVGEMLLAHELTHALQDQHFGIEDAIDRLKHEDDHALALEAVAEGDATLAGFAYVVGRLDASTADLVPDRLQELPSDLARQSPGAPLGLRDPLAFEYSAGTRFVAQAFKRGGWRAVDALYGAPPQSTQQVLHPSLYFDRPAPPLTIALRGYETALSGWRKVAEDTYGELLIVTILKRALGPGSPELELTRQWAGDRMVVLERDHELTVLWMVVFRDSAAADRFAAVYYGILDRMPGKPVPHGLGVDSRSVLVALGESARRFGELKAAVLQGTVINAAGRPAPAHRRAIQAGPRASLARALASISRSP